MFHTDKYGLAKTVGPVNKNAMKPLGWLIGFSYKVSLTTVHSNLESIVKQIIIYLREVSIVLIVIEPPEAIWFNNTGRLDVYIQQGIIWRTYINNKFIDKYATIMYIGKSKKEAQK